MFASIFQKTKILAEVLPKPTLSIFKDFHIDICGRYRRISRRKYLKKKHQIPVEQNNAKPTQEWWDWDGIGRYKSRHHGYPVNLMLRDVQKRRSFDKHHEERIRINSIWKNDILPQEIKDLAYRQIQSHPRDSTALRINRRCAVTGRARGIFHQFRVSRFVFRAEADYNKVSGAQRAHWEKGIHLKP